MKIPVFIAMLVSTYLCSAQELFVFSEPASTRPAKSVAFNLTARFPYNKSNTHFYNRYVPQVVVGVSKKLMVNMGAAFSNYYRANKLQFDGARVYMKYRFLSNDDVHRHFRLAAFAEGGFTANQYLYDEMSLDGDNNGVRGGLIATQLINRFALSGTAYFLRIFTKDDANHHSVLDHSLQMIGYSFSGGFLLLPKEYVDYKQMNLNLYLELLGSKCVDNNLYFIDIAPALQLIFNSNTKINIGGRFQLRGNMARVGRGAVEVGVERTILNFWK
jgi:hypothetical protein